MSAAMYSNGLKAAWESGNRTPAVTDLHEQLATALDDRRRTRALLGAAQTQLTASVARTGIDWHGWEQAVRECDRLAREAAETERDIRMLCMRIALNF